MKKLFRTMLPIGALLAVTTISAQYDSKAVGTQQSSSAERLAAQPTRGFTAPRAKSGNFGQLTRSAGSATLSLAQQQRLSVPSGYIEYVPDIKGMDFGAMSTTLNTIGTDGSLTPNNTVSLSANMGVPGGGYSTGDAYYFTIQYAYPYMNIFYIFGYDTETWQMLPGWPHQGSQRFMSTDLTYDPTDGKVYGCFTNDAGDGYEFGTADFAGGERATISSLPAAWNAIAADKNGQLYAIDMEGTLLKIDKSNGAATEIGATGFTPVNVSSATFDHKTGKLYWTVSTDTEGILCEVDTETGAATKIGDFPEAQEIYALCVIPPDAEDRAPAAPTNLRLDFTDASLTGTLLFDAPATLFRGEEGTGTMTYRVLNGETELATGSVTYGATDVRTPEFAVDAPGRYKFTLICTNDEGDSPKAEVEKFIGADAPAMVTGAKAEYAEGVFTVTWNAPAASANGGYINPDEVTYTVTRMPDNEVVASGIKQTMVTDAVAEPESYVKYKYAIQAEYDGWKSATVNTNGIGLGNVLPPYSDDFSDTSFLESYTAIDGNGDGRCWASFVGMAQGLGPVWGSEDSHSDEWLITPAVKLEGGKFYKFGIDAASMGTTYKETFEVAIGKQPTAEAMNQTIIPTTEVSTASFMSTIHSEEYFSVAETGVYYIGMHFNTAEGSYMLLLDNLTISAPIEAMSPAAVTDLEITPAPNGEKRVTMSFTAPETDLQGNALEFLDRIEVLMDGAPLKTFTGIDPGEQVSEEIEIPTSGTHKFTVTAWNGDTEGRPTETELHVGLNVPVAPGNVTLTVDNAAVKVNITWDAVTTDINGMTYPEGEVTYMVIRLVNGQQLLVAEGLTTTSINCVALPSPESEQEFFQFAVFAKSEAGYSAGNVTEMAPIGAPDTLPWVESFTEGGLNHIMAAHALDDTNGSWQNFGDQSFSMGVKSYDSDNGMIGMYGPTVGDKARLFTGRIDFSGYSHPTLSFYTFNLQSSETGVLDTNEISIKADNGDGQGFRQVKTLVVNDIANGVRGWAKAVVDLSDYAGQEVQLAFDAETKVYLYTLIDLIEISDRKGIDAATTSISAPKIADIDSEFEVAVNVENHGRMTVDSYTVSLYKNGQKIAEKEGEPLDAGKEAQHVFACTLNASDETENTLYAEVICNQDEDPANNRSEDVMVKLRHTDYPTVENLSTRRIDGNTVELSWEEPQAMPTADVRVTEDFESADTENTFPTEYGDWTLLDEDKGYIGGLRGLELPGIQTGSQQGFWVMDAAHPVFNGNTSYTANSGTKYLAQMYTMNLQGTSAVACDDWIISPLLNEKAQTVEFYAKSYGSDDTKERFQFLYSTTGTSPEDFTHVQTVPAVPHEWTKYTFDVPQGASYFAIRCTSIFEFMLFVDDITYTPANGSNIKLTGYNVFIDGAKATEEPITAKSYTDRSEAAASNSTRYSVSAVYTRGESAAVHATLDGSGVESVGSQAKVTSGKGFIEIACENETATVWSSDALCIYQGTVSGSKRISAPAGVYVVKLGEKIVKVVVK